MGFEVSSTCLGTKGLRAGGSLPRQDPGDLGVWNVTPVLNGQAWRGGRRSGGAGGGRKVVTSTQICRRYLVKPQGEAWEGL